MDDNSFISGLSGIGEAIGESSYGRSITLWITSCQPDADALCVRLGGPGSVWHTVTLPMTQPITIHRPIGASVLRRATELAIATPAYTEDAAADSEVLQRSATMAAMDVLTNTACVAAGSTLLMASEGVNAIEAPDTELVAAADEEDEHHAPLRVHFRWAIGEVLPGAPMAAAQADAAPELHSSAQTSSRDLSEHRSGDGHRDEEEDPLGADVDWRIARPSHAAAYATGASHTPPSAVLGDEDSTPNSSTDLTPFKPSPSAAAAAPPRFDAPGDSADPTTSVTGKSSTATAKPFADVDGEREGSAADDEATHDDEPLLPSQLIAVEAPPRTKSPFTTSASPLSLPSHMHGGSAEGKDGAAVSFSESDGAQEQFNREPSATLSVGHSSSRSNTPRRQRPRSARRSTVQMAVAPVMEDALAAKKADEAADSTDNSVRISDDDDDAPLQAMHRPPPPPPPTSAFSNAKVDSSNRNDGPKAPPTSAPSQATHFANSTARPPSVVPSVVPNGHTTHTPAPPPQPCVDNLFDGVNARELLVSVAVVAVVSTRGAADSHRIVSVCVDAHTADSSSSTACVSFQTTPALRSLAAVVPQLSPPALLHPTLFRRNHIKASAGEGDDGDAAEGLGKDVDRRIALRAVCTVKESVATANASTPSTVLWTAHAEVEDTGSNTKQQPSSSASLATQEVRFDGANGDVVLTRWTFITVGAYREAVLNLRCRADEPGEPTLQLLLVADDAAGKTTKTKSSHQQVQGTTPAHVWVAAPASHTRAVQHRFAAATPVHALVQQPLCVSLVDPLGYIAVHIPSLHSRKQPQHKTGSRKLLSHVEPILFRSFSEEWTCATSIKHASVTLYYRIVAPAASVRLPTLAPQLPSPFLAAAAADKPEGDKNASSVKVLREVILTVKPPSSLLTSVFTTSPAPTQHTSPASQQEAPASSWSLILRHAVTGAVLAESSLAATSTAGLTYRSFLPLSLEDATASASASLSETTPAASPDALFCLPWELLLIPAASFSSPSTTGGLRPAPPPQQSARRNSRSTMHDALNHRRNSAEDKRQMGGGDDASAWSGALFCSSAKLYSDAAATSSGGCASSVRTTLCVSASSSMSAAAPISLQSAATPLGALVEVSCEVRRHSLDAQSAVFCLRSLRIVPSPVSASGPNTTQSPQPPAPCHLRMWFTASGSSAEELEAAWATPSSSSSSPSEVPTAADVQRAWVPPASSPHASGSSPLLRTDVHGRLVSTGAPVLLSTENARARLCIACLPDATPAGAAVLAESESPLKSRSVEAAEQALRRRVVAVRKRAVHRYRKTQASNADTEDAGERQSSTLSTAAVAEMFTHCVNAVAMRVDNYAEVDLQSSLVASSERPGHSRHRLLLSFVSGTVRLSRGVVVELQGQWIKLPRKVAHVSEAYTPSPRLWALRCSCVVRRTGDDVGDTSPNLTGGAGAEGSVPLAQAVLEAERGYEVMASSTPLDYSDPSEDTVQKMLPGLSYDKLVVQMKQADRSMQPFRETITTTPAAPEATTVSEETGELLERIFGPTGVAHNAYISDASHKVAVVHFVFGDAYTTRTVVNVTCAAVAGVSAAAQLVKPHERHSYSPTPLRPSGGTASNETCTSHASSTVQVVCDSVTGSSTLYSFLPETAITRLFPGVSHRRYPPELTWYHGGLAIAADTEQQRRDEGQAAWKRGLTEQSLGAQQKPGPLVVSAVTHHPYESLPLVVEPSLTRCLDGRSLFVFGGISTTTGAATSRAFVLDVGSQRWLPLNARRGSRGTDSRTEPLPPRYGHTAVFRVSDGAVYVFGGRGRPEDAAAGLDEQVKGNCVYSDVWRLEWSMDTATLVCSKLDCTIIEAASIATSSSMITMESDSSHLARWRHAAVLHDDYLVVLGGLSSKGTCCSCRDLLYLDIKTREWCARRSFGADAPSPRYGHVAAVSASTSLYVFGGWTKADGTASALRSASASISLSSDDETASDGAHGAVAVADFYKMDLITRMWSRVEPNGTLRPPALELADMTACNLDGCPVLILVGGRTATAEPAAAVDEASAQLGVFLFSTDTLFWRQVRMDCTPVPNRFGLRAVVSRVAFAKAAAERAAAEDSSYTPDSTRLRRGLPTRGQRVGDIVVVGGLPLDETAVGETSPAITLLLAAGHGSAKGTQSRGASCGPRTAEAVRSPSTAQRTPRLPTVPRGPPHSAPRRPATGPPRAAPRRPAPSAEAQLRPMPPTLAWTQQRRGGDSDEDAIEHPPTMDSTRSPQAIRHTVNRLHSATSPSRRTGATVSTIGTARTTGGRMMRFNPERPSCYSTLTRRQQRQLIRRLYTNDLEIRAAHRETLEEQVQQERMTPVFPSSRSRSRSCSPGRQTTAARPPRVTSAPSQRPACDMMSNESPKSVNKARKENDTALDSPAKTPVPAAHRDLRSAFLTHSSSGSSENNSGSSMTTSSASSSSLSLSHRSTSEEDEREDDDRSSSFQPSELSGEEEAVTRSPRRSASEHSADDDRDDRTPSDQSDAEHTQSDKEEEEEAEAQSQKYSANERPDDYEDSFASSSTSSSRSPPPEAARPPAHGPPVLLPIMTEQLDSHRESSTSALLAASSAANSSNEALAATQPGKEAAEHVNTPLESGESSAAESYVHRGGVTIDHNHDEAAAAAASVDEAEVSGPASQHSTFASSAEKENKEQEGEEEREEVEGEEEAHDNNLGSPTQIGGATHSPPPPPVLPIALESDASLRASEDSFSDADAESDSAASENQEEDADADADAKEREEDRPSQDRDAHDLPAVESGAAEDETKSDAAAAPEDRAATPVEERTEGAADEHNGDDDDDDEWESFSSDEDEEEDKAKSEAPHPTETPSPSAAFESAQAAPVGAASDIWQDEADDELVPPPAPREHATPSPSASSVDSAPPRAPTPHATSDASEHDYDEDGFESEVRSDAVQEDEEAPAAMSEISASAIQPDADAGSADADQNASESGSVNAADQPAPPTPSAAEAEAGAAPVAASSNASKEEEEAYDDDFSDAAPDVDAPVARSLSPSASEHESVKEVDAVIEAMSDPESAEEDSVKEQQQVDLVRPHTPASAATSSAEAESFEVHEEEALSEPQQEESRARSMTSSASSAKAPAAVVEETTSEGYADDFSEGTAGEEEKAATPPAFVHSASESEEKEAFDDDVGDASAHFDLESGRDDKEAEKELSAALTAMSDPSEPQAEASGEIADEHGSSSEGSSLQRPEVEEAEAEEGTPSLPSPPVEEAAEVQSERESGETSEEEVDPSAVHAPLTSSSSADALAQPQMREGVADAPEVSEASETDSLDSASERAPEEGKEVADENSGADTPASLSTPPRQPAAAVADDHSLQSGHSTAASEASVGEEKKENAVSHASVPDSDAAGDFKEDRLVEARASTHTTPLTASPPLSPPLAAAEKEEDADGDESVHRGDAPSTPDEVPPPADSSANSNGSLADTQGSVADTDKQEDATPVDGKEQSAASSAVESAGVPPMVAPQHELSTSEVDAGGVPNAAEDAPDEAAASLSQSSSARASDIDPPAEAVQLSEQEEEGEKEKAKTGDGERPASAMEEAASDSLEASEASAPALPSPPHEPTPEQSSLFSSQDGEEPELPASGVHPDVQSSAIPSASTHPLVSPDSDAVEHVEKSEEDGGAAHDQLADTPHESIHADDADGEGERSEMSSAAPEHDGAQAEPAAAMDQEIDAHESSAQALHKRFSGKDSTEGDGDGDARGASGGDDSFQDPEGDSEATATAPSPPSEPLEPSAAAQRDEEEEEASFPDQADAASGAAREDVREEVEEQPSDAQEVPVAPHHLSASGSDASAHSLSQRGESDRGDSMEDALKGAAVDVQSAEDAAVALQDTTPPHEEAEEKQEGDAGAEETTAAALPQLEEEKDASPAVVPEAESAFDAIAAPDAADHLTQTSDALSDAEELSAGEEDNGSLEEEEDLPDAAAATPPSPSQQDDDEVSERQDELDGAVDVPVAEEAEGAPAPHPAEPSEFVDDDELDDSASAAESIESPVLPEAQAHDEADEESLSQSEKAVLDAEDELATPASSDEDGEDTPAVEVAAAAAPEPAELSPHASASELDQEASGVAVPSRAATSEDEGQEEKQWRELSPSASAQATDDTPPSSPSSERAANPFAAHDGASVASASEKDEWLGQGSTPAESTHDNPFAPVAATSTSEQMKSAADETDGVDNEHAAVQEDQEQRPQNDWGGELTSPPESRQTLPDAPAVANHETSEDEELNDGRDLLDRRRGVEEEVQDDDFDF